MDSRSNRVFISYRRDDAAGYAGRLEEALERRLGRGSVFRDVLDIPPGADFVAAIRARLAGAGTVLVLIGPRWAGGDTPGTRRIDDEGDFVRLEVAMALDSGVRVIPLLLGGVPMPAESTLPAPLKTLALRNALSLGETHWNADVDRLAGVIGLPPRRRWWAWAVGTAVVATGIGFALWPSTPAVPPAASPSPAAPDTTARVLGTWQAEVKYAWGDRYTERFELKRHAGELAGTATFLGYPRTVEKATFDGTNLHFQTRTQQSMGNETRELTHRYSAELRGEGADQRLALRMETSGAFHATPPLEFDARRAAPPDAASAASR